MTERANIFANKLSREVIRLPGRNSPQTAQTGRASSPQKIMPTMLVCCAQAEPVSATIIPNRENANLSLARGADRGMPLGRRFMIGGIGGTNIDRECGNRDDSELHVKSSLDEMRFESIGTPIIALIYAPIEIGEDSVGGTRKPCRGWSAW